jgi:sec-independent protein translocase protein TatA
VDAARNQRSVKFIRPACVLCGKARSQPPAESRRIVMGISIWQLLIILAIVLVIFGTKKLRDFGGDLGGAIKNFKTSMKDPNAKDEENPGEDGQKKVTAKPIEGKVTAKQTSRKKKKV